MTTTTWWEAKQNINEWIKHDWLNGDMGATVNDIFVYACETAEGCEYVIYYYHQRDLWAESYEVRAYQDDAIEAGCTDVESIQEFCVYHAIKDHITEAAPEIIKQNAVLSTITEDRTIYVNGVSVRIPVLAIEHTPKEA